MVDRPNRVGQQLGSYRLIRLLGEGGFAEVYLGEHIHLRTKAAVKVLRAQLTHENVKAFRKEARTIAHLDHSHIVRVLEFSIEGKTPFLVMGYAPHGTLRNLHPKGSSLAIATIVSYIKQVADALQCVHNEKLIHRDIKPENMLVGPRNEVFLSDFGIALVTQSSVYLSTQEIAGTVPYMAPEQIQGKPRPASDQYSLGIVVYEWLSGVRPFEGATPIEIAMHHLTDPPPPLREKLPMIAAEVEQVVMRALAKDPKQRFASVQAFATALEQASYQSSLSSRPIRQPISSEGIRKTFIRMFPFGGHKMRESLAGLTLGRSQGTDFLGQQPSNDWQERSTRKSPRKTDLTPKLSGQSRGLPDRSKYTLPVKTPESKRLRRLEVIFTIVVILLPLLVILFVLTHYWPPW